MASDLFDRLDEFERRLTDEEATGILDVAAHEIAQHYVLPRIVGLFMREFPRVRLRLLSRLNAEAIELVRRNQVDLCVVGEDELSAAPGTDELAFYAWRSFPSRGFYAESMIGVSITISYALLEGLVGLPPLPGRSIARFSE